MAQANRYTGKNLYMTIGGTVISTDYKSVAVKESVNSAEATGGSDAHEYSIPTYAASSISVEIFGLKKADTNYAAIMSGTAKGSTAALVYGPEGNTALLPKFTAGGYVESRDIDYKFDDSVNVKFTYKCTSAIAETTF